MLGFLRMPYSLQPVQRFLYDVCEPYLRLWRRFLPFLRFGPFDLSADGRRLSRSLIVAQIVIALLDGLH